MNCDTYSTGYYGIPGDRRSEERKVHIVSANKSGPLCGTKRREDSIFQWSSAGIHLPYVDCKTCLKIHEGKDEREAMKILGISREELAEIREKRTKRTHFF